MTLKLKLIPIQTFDVRVWATAVAARLLIYCLQKQPYPTLGRTQPHIISSGPTVGVQSKSLLRDLHDYLKHMTVQKISLIGKKLILRDWQENDLPIYQHWLHPQHRWYQFDGPYYGKPSAENVPNIVAKLKKSLPDDRQKNPRTRLVIATQETNQFIGLVSWYWQGKETNWISVGIVIHDESLWGQGLGYEALGMWCDYLFQAMPTIVRLDLRTWSGNYGMMHLAEKVGFQEEARFRMARIVNGEYFDGMGYGILREEWNQLYPDGF